MRQEIFTIQENAPVARDTYRIVLADGPGVTAPGQFVNVRLEGRFLRRPLSVSDWTADSLTLIYKTVGGGTYAMADMGPGQKLDLLTGLGNGFDITACTGHALLLGGGVGTAPLYGLAKALLAAGRTVTAVLGFGSADEVFYAKELAALGAEVRLATVDGSAGIKGFATDGIRGLSYDYYFACGPEPMLRAAHAACPGPGQLSFEARMGCGFGACMGCTMDTAGGPKRVCRDGPVFQKEEILWRT